MCKRLIFLTTFVLVFVFAFAFSTMAMASDIAFYVGQWNTDDWYDESQFQDVETIIAETGHLFKDIQQFDDTQFDEFGAWVDENTNDGEMDIIWLNGCTPSVLYPNPNEQPDGSRAEEWLDGGNMIINVGDWFAYCTYEGGPRGGEGRGGDNAGDGAANILDLSSGIIVSADGTQLTVTPTGKEYLPSLNDPAKTDRPVALAAVVAPWEVAAIFASPGGTDDAAAEAQADPVVIHNTETGGYVAFINQASGGPDGWIDDRGLTSAEFIGNWVNSVIGLGAAPAALPQGWQSQDIGTTGGSVAESDGTWAISADGADIWGSSDEFHYAYVSLSGNGTIVAQVVDNGTGSNGWAKGGVMIRETLDADSKHALMALTGGEGGGMGFQNRPETGGSSFSSHGDPAAAPPYWVKLTRIDNTITAYSSADGVEWVQQPDGTGGDMTTNPVDIEMAEDVLIGLFATSHAAGEVRTYTFDNVELSIPVTDPNLLIYYNFESGAGTTVVDRSGHGNHSEFFGNPEWVEGIFGGALAIDIADLDYIQTLAPLDIVSNTVTVTGWVKHDESPAGWSGILTHRGTDPGCLGLQHDGTELRYMWGADVYWSFSSGLLIPNGEWYFAALAISPDQGKLYLNGIEQTATNVAPHEPTNFDSLIRVGRDHNDDRIMTSLIDEVRFYNRTLTDVDIQRLLLSDVTAPGDNVVGDPNDGDWPGAETPDLAIDDDINTKYLHFKGETETTGFQVTPAAGPSIVTGLTFTTANDAAERDPIAFELSGSNEGIDGPYELIASGDIVDFAQADAWPRFTMNATPISFDNDVAYAHYQVLFPAVRDAASANSMQIAEVELLGELEVEADIAAIKELWNQYTLATTSGDIELYLSLWDDNGVSMAPDAPAIIGKAQIRPVMEGFFAVFNLESPPIFVEEVEVAGDWGFSRVTFTMSLTPWEGGETSTRSGKALSILKRQADGSWKVYIDCWNYDAPLPAPLPAPLQAAKMAGTSRELGLAKLAAQEADADAIVREMYDEIELAYATGDVDLYVGIYTADAMQMPPDAPIVIGSEQIRASTQMFFDAFSIDAAVSLQEAVITGEWGFDRCIATHSITPKEGGPTTSMYSKVLEISKRQADGSWKCYIVCWNSNVPPPTEE